METKTSETERPGLEVLVKLAPEVAKLRMTMAQVTALAMVGGEEITISELAKRMGCSVAGASGMADTLERKGQLVRARGKDRREVTIQVTARGAAKLQFLADALRPGAELALVAECVC
jgi:DNA-binding MarR family transcriptional regulator